MLSHRLRGNDSAVGRARGVRVLSPRLRGDRSAGGRARGESVLSPRLRGEVRVLSCPTRLRGEVRVLSCPTRLRGEVRVLFCPTRLRGEVRVLFCPTACGVERCECFFVPPLAGRGGVLSCPTACGGKGSAFLSHRLRGDRSAGGRARGECVRLDVLLFVALGVPDRVGGPLRMLGAIRFHRQPERPTGQSTR
jgi:hypothetical protein